MLQLLVLRRKNKNSYFHTYLIMICYFVLSSFYLTKYFFRSYYNTRKFSSNSNTISCKIWILLLCFWDSCSSNTGMCLWHVFCEDKITSLRLHGNLFFTNIEKLLWITLRPSILYLSRHSLFIISYLSLESYQ